MNFILGQVMSGVALCITIIGFQQKNKNAILFLLGFANIFYSISYFFLGALSGMVLEIVATIRMFVFYFLNKSSRTNPLHDIFVLLIFELAIVVGSIFTFNSNMWFACVIQLSGYALYTYGCWQKNIFVYYTTYLYVCVCVIVYNIFFAGWLNIGIHVLLMFIVLRSYLSKKNIGKGKLIKIFKAYRLKKNRNKSVPIQEFD